MGCAGGTGSGGSVPTGRAGRCCSLAGSSAFTARAGVCRTACLVVAALLAAAGLAHGDVVDTAAVSAEILSRLEAPDVRRVELLQPLAPFAAEPGAYELSVPQVRGSSGVAGLVVREAGRVVKNIRVPFRVIKCVTVAVAGAEIPPGQMISAAQVVMEERCGQAPAVSPGSGLFRARRKIAKGTVLVPELLERVIDARVGSQVRLNVVSGGAVVSSTGRLLVDASVGQSVRVRGGGSQELVGLLVAPDTVEVVL